MALLRPIRRVRREEASGAASPQPTMPEAERFTFFYGGPFGQFHPRSFVIDGVRAPLIVSFGSGPDDG